MNERASEFEFSLWWDSIEHLQKFWGDADGPSGGAGEEFPIVLTFDAGPITPPGTGANRTMEIRLARAYYASAQQQASGRDELVQTVAGRGLLADVILEDGLTEVSTDVYVRLVNDQPSIV